MDEAQGSTVVSVSRIEDTPPDIEAPKWTPPKWAQARCTWCSKPATQVYDTTGKPGIVARQVPVCDKHYQMLADRERPWNYQERREFKRAMGILGKYSQGNRRKRGQQWVMVESSPTS